MRVLPWKQCWPWFWSTWTKISLNNISKIIVSFLFKFFGNVTQQGYSLHASFHSVRMIQWCLPWVMVRFQENTVASIRKDSKCFHPKVVFLVGTGKIFLICHYRPYLLFFHAFCVRLSSPSLFWEIFCLFLFLKNFSSLSFTATEPKSGKLLKIGAPLYLVWFRVSASPWYLLF